MNKEQTLLKNIEAQHRVIINSFKKDYKATCKKCGSEYKTDADFKEGICEQCI